MGLFQWVKDKREAEQKALVDRLMIDATQKAQDLILQDPVFAAAYKTKIEFEQRQRELDTVLDFGMTERVIRQLIEGAVAKQVVVTITWPAWLDANGGRMGGQIMSIQPIDQYSAMKKRLEGSIPF